MHRCDKLRVQVGPARAAPVLNLPPGSCPRNDSMGLGDPCHGDVLNRERDVTLTKLRGRIRIKSSDLYTVLLQEVCPARPFSLNEMEGRDVIVDIDGQGARQIREKDPRAIFIFILPPSWEELRRRLSLRKTEDPAALEERLKKSRLEVADGRWYDYLIVNHKLEKAQKELAAIIRAEHCRRERVIGVLEEMLTGN